MALPLLVTPDEFRMYLAVDVFDSGQLGRATIILGMAGTRVRKFAGETYVDEEGELLDDIDEAIAAVVMLVASRVWQNPRSVVTQGAGPFSETVTAETAELLNLTETEEQMIAATLDKPSPGLAVISTTRGRIETASVRRCGDWLTVADLDDI